VKNDTPLGFFFFLGSQAPQLTRCRRRSSGRLMGRPSTLLTGTGAKHASFCAIHV
jgi:hypothetical protein